jgi:hypothetical protein
MTTWAAKLDPVLKNPLSNGNFVTNQKLVDGVNVVNHGLQRTPQGWFVTDINGIASIYRSAPFNKLTLQLTCSAAVTVNLYVF